MLNDIVKSEKVKVDFLWKNWVINGNRLRGSYLLKYFLVFG